MPINLNSVGSTPASSSLSAPEGDPGIKDNLGTKTGIKGKVQEARFQKVADLASFAENNIKLKELRINREGQSGIYKSLFRHGEKNEIKKLQSEIKSQIKHYKFGHNESDAATVKMWGTCVRNASPKDKEVIYNTIRDKLLAPEHQFNPNILKQLHELAGDDKHIQPLRDAYLYRSFEHPPSIRTTNDDMKAIIDKVLQSNTKNIGDFTEMQDAELSQLQTQRTNRYIETAKVWLEIANATPPKTQQAMYARIQTALNKGDYVPEVLTHLNEQANAKENKDNPHIAALRDTYVEAKSHRFLGDFRSNLNAALNGSTEDKIAFIKQFEGNLSLNNQPTQIIQKEHEAIKALLAKDNITPSNRVFLQQMDLAYEMKLNENNPKKMLELASQFIELEKPLLQQVVQNISQTEEISEAQKQEISAMKGMTETASRMCDAMFSRTTESVSIASFKTKGDAYLKIYGNHATQGIMRLNSLMKEMEKRVLQLDLKIAKSVARELQEYISHFSSNTALFTARVEEASIKELQSFNPTGLINANDHGFIEFDKRHSLIS